MNLLEKLRIKRSQEINQKAHNPLYTKNYTLSYITGSSALNIPYEGVQCDWHQVDTLRCGRNNGFVTHPETIIGAEDILGTLGIWNCSEWLQERGFVGEYECATPIRAFIDILYYWIVVKNRYPQTLDGFQDYMIDEIDFTLFFQMLQTLQEYLSEDQLVLLKQWEIKNHIDDLR